MPKKTPKRIPPRPFRRPIGGERINWLKRALGASFRVVTH